MSSVPGRAGVGFGCCFQEGVRGAFPGVFREKVFLCVRLVVVPFLLLPPREGQVACFARNEVLEWGKMVEMNRCMTRF